MANSTEETVEKKRRKKLFLNNLDSFNGRNIGKYLASCSTGGIEGLLEKDGKSRDTLWIDGNYEVVGTAIDKELPKPDFAKEIVQYENQNQLYEYIVECDIIIYDITDVFNQISEAVWIITEMSSDLEKLDNPKVFILISTVLTWDRTKPKDATSSYSSDTEQMFTEEDYRKRKPHPLFKEHINAEKTVLRLGKMSKSKLETYVISSGLTYGAEEHIFHHLFKSAWHNAQFLPVIGNGQNCIPTIHVTDLAAVIQNVADGSSKYHYIIAKDNSQNNLEDIAKAVSENLGSKAIQYISKDEALYMAELDLDMYKLAILQVNLKMESLAIKDMNIQWVSEAGLVENIKQMIQEYKDSRHLLPFRAIILGPPASGKTTVAKQLCDYYKIHHICLQEVIDEAIEELKNQVQSPSSFLHQELEGDEAYQKMMHETVENAWQLLLQINASRELNNGRIHDSYIISFVRKKLLSMPCQNQGFILDGYPKTISQAQELFKNDIEDEMLESTGEIYNKNILPDFIINLEATDNFLKRRVMSLPESVIRGTHNTERQFQRRLKEYWAMNTYEETVLNFFDELELDTEKIDVTKDLSKLMKDTVEKIKKIFGNPRNYGSTSEEWEKLKEIEEIDRQNREAQKMKEIEEKEAKELHDRKTRQEDWTNRLNEVKKQEFDLMEIQSIPLRNYLMKYVMPTLTQGLMECCKVRPEDPVDFLAEFLFQNNPQID